MGAQNGETREAMVVCQSNQGLEIRASLLRLTRYVAVFEIYSNALVLRTSEVLHDFKIMVHDRAIYAGRAVIRSLVNTGVLAVCEVALDERSWMDVVFASARIGGDGLAREFDDFLQDWQKLYRVSPEFKVVAADMQSFLAHLRMWLEQVELEIRSSPSADRSELERGAVNQLAKPAIRAIDSFIDRFEEIAAQLEPDVQPVHREYLRRQWHPLILSSPFAYRTYHKPLGYAGDYEMVAMMLRDPQEGSTLFAKLINVWLLNQAPAEGHRNRVNYLLRKLVEETMRVRSRGRVARVFNLGCGPAAEVQRLLSEYDFGNGIELTLLDFNEETLQHLQGALNTISRTHSQRTPVTLIKRSVHQLLKEASRTVGRTAGEQYDLVYCGGLFDYLSDNVCKRLMNLLYESVAPDGMLLITNVNDTLNQSRPFRYSMEYLLDWNLIYRTGRMVEALAPDRALRENVRLVTEDTGANIFLEIRKPAHG
jgi:extracellular factor (EF) 3-hydroxypalmitic acid methyl ester biosynthesis protein